MNDLQIESGCGIASEPTALAAGRQSTPEAPLGNPKCERGKRWSLAHASGYLSIASWKLTSLALAILVFVGSATFADDGHNHLPKKQHKDSEAPFLKPAEAVAKMSIPDGFEVSVFASEPDIAEPIAFCFDDRGRMWVAENFNYQTRRQHTD